jgi:hypothetical protein
MFSESYTPVLHWGPIQYVLLAIVIIVVLALIIVGRFVFKDLGRDVEKHS